MPSKPPPELFDTEALPPELAETFERIADYLRRRTPVQPAAELARAEQEASDLADQLAQALLTPTLERIRQQSPELKDAASKMLRDLTQRPPTKRRWR